LTQVLEAWSAETKFVGAIASASSVARYLKTKRLEGVRRVVDFVDVDSQKWLDYKSASSPPMSWIYGAESRRLLKLEKAICRWADAVTLVSEHEATQLRELTGANNIHTITNGVDLDYFTPATPGAETGCVFVGALDYLPNIDGISWFARTIWPNVRLKHPDARLTIVGRKPARAVLELRAVPGVDVAGQVADVRPYLDNAAVVVAPLRIARGLQNKVLEAFAVGKSVVASPVALAGFGDRPDLPACRAKDSEDWIGMLLELFANPDARRRLGHAARIYAETHHNWSNCLTPFQNLFSMPKPIAIGEGS
jgi:sugar transferase (PEP-CTERM/EpsH1 system associated)